MHGHGETAAQFGESDEQHAQAVLGVRFVIAQEPEVLKDVVAQVVRFVDDEDGELFGLAHQAGDFRSDGAVGAGARAFGGQAELDDGRFVVSVFGTPAAADMGMLRSATSAALPSSTARSGSG